MDIIQEGSISPTTSKAQQVALKLYNERIKFFCAHKDEEWFKNKYHPDDSVIQKKKRTLALKKRFDIFNEFLANGKIDSVSVDTNNRDTLVSLLDSVIIQLQGGTDFDLTVFNTTETSKTQQEPEHEKKETNKKINDGEADSDKKDGDETNKIDKSVVNNTEEAMDFQNFEMSNVWKGRVWSVDGITNHLQVARNDLKLCAFIINVFDDHSDLVESIECKHPAFDKMYEVLCNPDMASSEEEILLSESNIRLLKALDRMILYLRIVHSIDFYNFIEYAYEDDMQSRSSVIHVRGPQIRYPPTQQEITDYFNYSQKKADRLTVTTCPLTESEITHLRTVDEEKAMDFFIKDCIERKSHRKWLCKISGKIFKRRKDGRKNIIKNYSDTLNNVKKYLKYFNNFVLDPNRPKQIPHSYPTTDRYQTSG